MVWRFYSCGHVALGVSLVIAGVGCSTAYTSTRWSHTIYRGPLDECREIELSYDIVRDRTGLEPEQKFEQLVLEVNPRECLHFERALKTIDLTPGVPRGQLKFQNVDGRIDETRQRVWFVQRDTGRVLATFDRKTGETTGPDDKPPAWATPDAGTPLGSSSD